MKPKKIILLVILQAILLVSQAQVQVIEDDRPIWQTGKIYLKIKDNSNVDLSSYPRILNDTSHLLTNVMTAYDVTAVEKPFSVYNKPRFDRIYRVSFTNPDQVEQFISDLTAIGFVEYAEKVPANYSFVTTNDPVQPYHLNMINAGNAWDIHQGGNAIIAIVDDAVLTTHEDLAANIVSQRDVADGDNDANPPLSGTNAANPSTFSHGTHVAGIACGVTNNGIGMASIGWNNKIMCVKTNYDNGTPGYIPCGYDGIAWAAANGADVINTSWGGSGYSQSDYWAIEEARYTYNAVIVSSAGNSYSINYNYPAAYGEGTTSGIGEVSDRSMVIAVAALNSDNDIADPSDWGYSMMGAPFGSNYGHWVDISTYGTDIFSCVANSSNGSPINNYYDSWNGTSMAAPIVSGVAGLMRSYNQTATVQDIYNCLIGSANTDIYDASHPNNTFGMLGSGRLDAEAAIKCLGVDCAYNPNAVVFPSSQTICPSGNVTLSCNSGINYSWSTGANTQSINVNQAGTYSVTITFTGGCTASDSFTLNNADTQAHIIINENSGFYDNDGILCSPSMVVLSSYWGSSYYWTPFGFTTPSTNSINCGNNPGSATFSVTITDVAGCAGVNSTATAFVQWFMPPVVNITTTLNAICLGEVSTLTASGGTSYLWENGSTTSSIDVSPIVTTTYSVTVTNNNGCTDTESITITVNSCSNGLDLFLKDTNDDDGSEPFAGTGNIWQSPDLVNKWSIYNPITVPMVDQGVLYGSYQNCMYAKLRNDGPVDYLAPVNAHIEFYWTRARTGEDWPIHWDATNQANQNANGDPQGGFIASVPVNQDILIGQDRNFYAAWTPPDPSTLTSSVTTFPNGLPMICYLARFVHPADPMAYETPGIITPHIIENNNVVTRNSWIESISKFPRLSYDGPVFWLTADREMSTSLVFEPVNEPDSSTFNDWGEISIYLHEDIFDQWLKDGSYGTGFTINTKERKLTLTGNSAIIDSIMLVQGDDYPVMVTYTLKKFANPLENYHYEYIIRSYNRTDSTETGGFHFDVTVKPPVNFLCEITETINTTNPKTCDGSATVTGFGGTPPYSFQWSRSAGNQTTPTAVGLCIGTHTVIVTDSIGAADTASVTIYAINNKNLIIDNSEDIQPIEQKIDNYINIYPNPSKGIINVDYSVPAGISSTLVFYDVNGRKISSYNLESNSKRICLNDETIFSEGVYYYSLIIGNEVVTRDKLVIIK
jgi:subtilisin family serine protease